MNAFNQSLIPLSEPVYPYTAQAHQLADESTIRTLLNCYIREVATPNGQLTEQPPAAILQSLPFGWRQQHRNTTWLLIDLDHNQQQLMIAVSRATLMGNYRYAYPVLSRTTSGAGAAWKALQAGQLALLLVGNLCEAQGIPYNHEFLQQIQLSQNNTQAILRHSLSCLAPAAAVENLYLYSEQSLIYGHPFHPTPKSRQWQNHSNEAEYAPEYRGDFQLHWFRVRPDLMRIDTVAPLTPAQLLQDICPEELAAQDPMTLLPVHPAQAEYLLQQAATRQAISDGLIDYLGPAGKAFAPTASVRTLYHPDSRWFLKGSLNIRITNCVRKNAIYELESALALHRRLQIIEPALKALHSGFRLLGEPGFITLQLPGLDPDANKVIQEGFAMVVRENISAVLGHNEQVILAGALFQQGEPLKDFVTISDQLQWLEQYARAIIPPVLEAFFEHGVIFEPHLQNTLICLQDNQPSGVILRDFEGVKLVDQQWPEAALQDLSPRARQSVRYSFQQGWNRVRYCLLINNLAEAVSYLAADQPELEAQLWQRLARVIRDYRDQSQNAVANDCLTRLLAGEDIPSKTNLLVRITKNPDRAAGYVPVKNPFNLSGE